MIVEDHIRPAAEKLGLRPEDCTKFGLHNLRHGLSTFMIESGAEPLVVMRALRHSNPKMTMHYSHLGRKARCAQGKYLAKLLGGKRVQMRVRNKKAPMRGAS